MLFVVHTCCGNVQHAAHIEIVPIGNTLGGTPTPQSSTSTTIIPGVAQSSASPVSLLGSVPGLKGTGGIMESIPLDDSKYFHFHVCLLATYGGIVTWSYIIYKCTYP